MNTLHRKMVDEICKHFGCTFNDIFSRRRQKNVVYAKKVIYWILRREGLTYNQIARLVNKDHETVLVGIRTLPTDYKTYALSIFSKYKKWGLKISKEYEEKTFFELMGNVVDLMNKGFTVKQIAKELNYSVEYIIDKISLHTDQKKVPDYQQGSYKIEYFLQKNKKTY